MNELHAVIDVDKKLELEYGSTVKLAQVLMAQFIYEHVRQGADPGAVLVGMCLSIGRAISRFPNACEANVQIFASWIRHGCLSEVNRVLNEFEVEAKGKEIGQDILDNYKLGRERMKEMAERNVDLINRFNENAAETGQPLLNENNMPGLILMQYVMTDPRFVQALSLDAMAAQVQLQEFIEAGMVKDGPPTDPAPETRH